MRSPTKIKVDAAGLRDSVARNNRSAESGVDEDFGKGSTDFDRHNGDPGHMAESLHRPDRCAALLRDGGLSQHARLKRRA